MVKMLHSQWSRCIYPVVFVLVASLMLVAIQGCAQTSDTDPEAKAIPTSREAK